MGDMLTHVTFTGWDRNTEPHAFAEFLQWYPPATIEVAVLFSLSRQGTSRYPDLDTACKILEIAKASRQRTAVHFCGDLAREALIQLGVPRVEPPLSPRDHIASGRIPSVAGPSLVSPLFELPDRIQVNVHEGFWSSKEADTPGERTKYSRAHLLARRLGKAVVVQVRGDEWPEDTGPGVEHLFDRSAGTGLAPDRWPPPPQGRHVGYAGGLEPGVVEPFLHAMPGSRLRDRSFWIDMESGIRDGSAAYNYVSLNKCSKVMLEARPYIRVGA